WIYSILWLHFEWGLDSLRFFVIATLGNGVLPMSFLVLWNANRLLRKHLTEAKVLQTQKAVLPIIPENNLLSLVADNQKDRLELAINDLLFMRSADNYVEILYRSGKEVKRILLRATLSRFAKQLENYTSLMRCHRAFVVNLRRIEGFSGDSQGYKLRMEGTDDRVSVSRRYIPPFRERFASLQSTNIS
ncbi:MAG: LytTR family DNA-binding domain-containing protein, partial [Bacteroidota bacterium]